MRKIPSEKRKEEEKENVYCMSSKHSRAINFDARVKCEADGFPRDKALNWIRSD